MTRIADDEVRAGYARQHGRPMLDADLDAFFRLAQMFDVAPVGTYESIHAEICQAMESPTTVEWLRTEGRIK